jgi:DNA-directed RNA polymerase subunit RPC12/RpoP
MCLLVFKPIGQKMPEEFVENANENNDDGMGIYHQNKIFKTLHNVEKVKQICQQDEPCVVHFRLGTQGLNNVDNCHPHKIRDGLWLFHNGILIDMPNHHELSDTAIFARKMHNWNVRIIKQELNKRGNSTNKFILIEADKKKATLFGEFHIKDGVYYSNTSYKKRYYTITYGYHTTHSHNARWNKQFNSILDDEMCELCYVHDDKKYMFKDYLGNYYCSDCWKEIKKESYLSGWSDDKEDINTVKCGRCDFPIDINEDYVEDHYGFGLVCMDCAIELDEQNQNNTNYAKWWEQQTTNQKLLGE